MKGTYKHCIDTKGRFIVPARLREELGERFIVTRGLDECLALYPAKEWDELESRIRALPMSRAHDLQRFLFSAACDAEIDSQGRVLLPAGLRAFAGLTRDVTIIGASNHAEVWDTARWTAYCAAVTGERIGEVMEELGF